jgi:hypothetical protein
MESFIFFSAMPIIDFSTTQTYKFKINNNINCNGKKSISNSIVMTYSNDNSKNSRASK